MPLVLVRHDKSLSGRFLEDLALELQKITARHLDVAENEEARLSPADVEIWNNRARMIDANVKDLQIVILANDYPERRANLEERKEGIRRDVKVVIGQHGYTNITGFVWVLLVPGAFGEL